MNKFEYLKEFKGWVNALKHSTDNHYDEIIDILEGKKDVPAGCPSKESLAHTVFRQITEALDEVNTMRAKLDEHFYD